MSFPIPERRPTRRSPFYDELAYAPLLRSLGYPADGPAHLDPDLVAGLRPREPGWRGTFGQGGAAASHLVGRNVGAGDLFLFFGLFRRVESEGVGCDAAARTRGSSARPSEMTGRAAGGDHARRTEGGYRFARDEKPFHAIWGYLEVERRMRAADGPPDWARDHPHFADPGRGRPNLVFLARKGGFGVFRYRDELRLTRPGAQRVTEWRLPPCFDGLELTYHPRPARNGRLRSASRGQEFVCDATDELEAWADALIAESERWGA